MIKMRFGANQGPFTAGVGIRNCCKIKKGGIEFLEGEGDKVKWLALKSSVIKHRAMLVVIVTLQLVQPKG